MELFNHQFKFPFQHKKIILWKWLGLAIEWILGINWIHRCKRQILTIVPFIKLRSKVEQVVYLSWLVDIEKVRPYLPNGIRLWEKNGKTIFSILTYQHKYFGPAFLGRLRRICGSPKQSNWRFYIDGVSGQPFSQGVVLFDHVIVDQMIYAVGSRMLSDAMPAHYAPQFKHDLEQSKNSLTWITEIQTSGGSARNIFSNISHYEVKELPFTWQKCFSTWEEAVELLCMQDFAITHTKESNVWTKGEICLPISRNTIQPAVAKQVYGDFIDILGINELPFCFVVPEIEFSVISEKQISIA